MYFARKLQLLVKQEEKKCDRAVEKHGGERQVRLSQDICGFDELILKGERDYARGWGLIQDDYVFCNNSFSLCWIWFSWDICLKFVQLCDLCSG
jgi:hypothetical protein